MKIAICDDEQAETLQLKKLIYDCAAVQNYDIVCDCFTSAAELLQREKYDVYFLDYAMPEMTGTELAVQLKQKFNNAVTVCFLTSYERAAVDVINNNVYAEAFLIKPADPGRLKELLTQLYTHSCFRRMMLKKEKAVCVIYPQDVLYVEAQDKECRFRFYDHDENFTYKLSVLEDEYLPKNLFFRSHRSYLVNLMHIAAFNKNSVTIKNGEALPLSRYRAFREAFSAFNFKAI